MMPSCTVWNIRRRRRRCLLLLWIGCTSNKPHCSTWRKGFNDSHGTAQSKAEESKEETHPQRRQEYHRRFLFAISPSGKLQKKYSVVGKPP